MKTNKLDNFESFINDSLSGEEVAYNPSDWNDLSSRLDNVSPKPFYKKGWFLGGAAAIVIGATSLALFNNVNTLDEKELVVADVNEKPASKQLKPIIEEEVSKEAPVIIKEEIKETKNNKSTSSETIGKEEIVNELDANHSKPQSLLPISSTTDFIEEEHKNNPKEEISIELPNARFNSESSFTGCKGLVVELSATPQKDVTYLWSFGDGEFSKELNPTHQYNASGTYKIELIVQSTLDKGILTKSDQEGTVVVFEDPNLDIVKTKSLDRGLTTVNFSYVGDEVEKVFWNLGNGESSIKKDVSSTYKKRGNYKILLESTSLQGCKSIVEENIFIEEDYNLLTPNAFTPNGDGQNDLFIPEALKSMNSKFTMVIRSRTSGIVFESTSLDRPWDGKNQETGLDCLEDNYIWVVSLINEKGIKEQYSGTVLITR